MVKNKEMVKTELLIEVEKFNKAIDQGYKEFEKTFGFVFGEVRPMIDWFE